MKKFDFYEYAGILVPGAALLIGAVGLFPELSFLRPKDGLNIGELPVFLVLIYICGHLMQSFGNAVEWFWWKLGGGMPTDWPRVGKRDLIGKLQATQLSLKVREMLDAPETFSLKKLSAREWKAITRQIYGKVSDAGAAERVNIFNGNYGLCRGLSVAFLILTYCVFVSSGLSNVITLELLSIAFLLSLLRMHRFGVHYARELFVRFLASSDKTAEE